MNALLLELHNVNTHYGALHVLQDLSLELRRGEIVCLLGGNACGKSTTLKTILGLVPVSSGSIRLTGEAIERLPTSARISRGIAVVPENRRLFAPLSVYENLLMGAHQRRDKARIFEDLDRVYELFPRLYERSRQPAGTLSGGEQQMLAVGRALMSRPQLVLMDEPSMGLAPKLIEHNFALIERLNREGLSILMVEQNANMALSIAHRGYVLQTGRIVLRGSAGELRDDEHLRQAYLGKH